MALFSIHESSAYAPLAETDNSLWRQSFARPDQRQGDGWGIAWYGADRRRLFKSPRPLFRDKFVFQKVSQNAVGRCVIFHLRRASNPRRLPLRRLRGRQHNQPYVTGRWVFTHNGSIPFPDETARGLGSYRSRIRGRNDSEVLFWLLMKSLRQTGSIPQALRRTRATLKRVFQKKNGSFGDGNFHHGLNMVLSNGHSLWAYAESPPGRPREGGSLGMREWPYFQIAYLPGKTRFWVASEPAWSGAAWRPLRSGHLLEVRNIKEKELKWSASRLVPVR